MRAELAEAFVAGDETLLGRMAANLVDNAVRYNEPGGSITLRTAADGPVARLVVESGGAVLDQEKVSQLAQPFRRLAAERTGSTIGVGLGLSIVSAVAAAHGGTLELRARPEGGLRVVVELARAAAPAHAGAPA